MKKSLSGNRKIEASQQSKKLSQKEKFLKIAEETCYPIEDFERKIKKISRVKKLEEKKNKK